MPTSQKRNRVLIAVCLCWFFSSAGFCAEKKTRIISVSPEATEILYYLKASDSIIAVSSHCNFPAEVKTKTKIGSFSWVNTEEILALSPDLVITTGLEQQPMARQLKALGVETIVCYPKNIQELYGTISLLAEFTQSQSRAQELIKDLKLKIKNINDRIKNVPDDKRPRVTVQLWDEPLIVAGDNSFVGELVRSAGGINIAFDTQRPYSRFSLELLLERDPDIIIFPFMQKGLDNRFEKNFAYRNLKAVRENRVITDINPDIVLRAGPRAAEAIEKLYEIFYQ